MFFTVCHIFKADRESYGKEKFGLAFKCNPGFTDSGPKYDDTGPEGADAHYWMLCLMQVPGCVDVLMCRCAPPPPLRK